MGRSSCWLIEGTALNLSGLWCHQARGREIVDSEVGRVNCGIGPVTDAHGAGTTIPPAQPPTCLSFPVLRIETQSPRLGSVGFLQGRAPCTGVQYWMRCVGVEAALASGSSGGSLLPQEEWKSQNFLCFQGLISSDSGQIPPASAALIFALCFCQ